MLTVEQALERILTTVQSIELETILLANAYGRVLANDLITPHPSPPFDKAMMDGFVLHTTQGTDQIQTFEVLETITAGDVPQCTLQPGQASQIMTGALIPSGGNCVVPIERVQQNDSTSQQVVVNADDIVIERHILRSGHNAATGDLLMPAGTVLSAQHVAVLAEFGVARVSVFRQPKIAVLATGNELLSVDSDLEPGKIRNSNEPMLLAQLQRCGTSGTGLGIAQDNRSDLRQKIAKGLDHDILLLSGGVSAGAMDLVPSELAAAGVQQVFHKVRMKPGKPLWFGTTKTKRPCYVFGLPGNPVSSLTCFEIFVKAAIRRLQQLPEPDTEYGRLKQPMTVKGDRITWFPCELSSANGQTEIHPVKWSGSADLRSTANANGMCRLEPRDQSYPVEYLLQIRRW